MDFIPEMFAFTTHFLASNLIMKLINFLPVSTEQFHDDLSDDDMHPDPELPENENTKFMKKNPKVHQDEVTTAYWLNNAKSFVEQQAQRTPNTKKAKNIIMFLGDGMSHPTVAAARVYIGGEDKKLAFENLPYTASSKTYCVDYQVGDSACTATAYLSGVKTNDGMIGVSARGLSGNCEDAKDPTKITESIAVWAMREGKEAGVVTTTRITHASPAGVYGHVTDRDFENDYNVKYYGCDPDLVDDIAEQMVHGDGMNLKVMLGGGSRSFVDQTMTENDRPGYRTDGKNLIDEWKAMEPERVFVNNKQDMLNVPSDVHKLFGLFHTDHIPYNIDILRDGLQDDIPSLTDMTVKAIEILSQNEEGFFLFVEGGRIDHGHHATQAKHALDETAEFSKAIEAALGMIDLEETLVVVTADHSHVMTMAGYAVSEPDLVIRINNKTIFLTGSW